VAVEEEKRGAKEGRINQQYMRIVSLYQIIQQKGKREMYTSWPVTETVMRRCPQLLKAVFFEKVTTI